MSKCRPGTIKDIHAIADFLRSVHINGKPLDLPENISELHYNPRNQLNLMKHFDINEVETDARAFDVAEAVSGGLEKKISELDARINSIIKK